MRVIMTYLTPREVLTKLGVLNKTCHRVSRDSAHWRSLITRDFPDLVYVGKHGHCRICSYTVSFILMHAQPQLTAPLRRPRGSASLEPDWPQLYSNAMKKV